MKTSLFEILNVPCIALGKVAITTSTVGNGYKQYMTLKPLKVLKPFKSVKSLKIENKNRK